MAQYNAAKLITPPTDDDTHPYRRAWQSVTIESGILIAVAGVLFVTAAFLGTRIPQALHLPVNIVLALLPALLWLIFSLWRERFAELPRRGLLATAIVTALVANAIGLPLLNDFVQPESWLALQPAVNRIIGYTVTVGIIHEFLKYLVLRYLTWPHRYRAREDAIAYSAASAIGYSTVLALSYVLNTGATPDVVASRVLSITTLQLAASVIVGYGLVQLVFSQVTTLLLPMTLVAAAGLHGLAIPLRSGLVNATLTVDGAATRPLFGFVFAVGFFILPMLAMYFLYQVADRRDRNLREADDSA